MPGGVLVLRPQHDFNCFNCALQYPRKLTDKSLNIDK